MAITPDSRYVLFPGGSKLSFWDIATGKPSDRFEGEQPSISRCNFPRR